MSSQPRAIPFPFAAPAPPPAKRSRTPIMLLALALALAAGGCWYAFQEREVSIQAVSPQYGNIESTVSAMGLVVPVDNFPARAAFTGIVTKIYVHVGDKVHAGQMLVEMKDQYALSRLRNAIADLQADEMNLDNVENNGSLEDRIAFAADWKRAETERDDAAASLATLEQLQQRGSATGAEVLAGEERLQAAETNINTLEQRMHHRYSPADLASWKDKVSADEASVAAERVSWGNAHISSPISGTVYLIPVSLYDFVPGGSELLRVADLDRLEVRTDFLEPDIGKLQMGEPVTITWDGAPGRSWQGHVAARPMAVERRPGDFGAGRCVIALDTHDGLPANSNVTVTVDVKKDVHVLSIPRQALHEAGAEKFVYRVIDGRLNKTPVTVGLLNAMRAEIDGGLTSKDTIALSAADDRPLRNNLRVKIENKVESSR